MTLKIVKCAFKYYANLYYFFCFYYKFMTNILKYISSFAIKLTGHYSSHPKKLSSLKSDAAVQKTTIQININLKPIKI